MGRLFRFIALLGFGLALGAFAFTRSGAFRTFIESTPCAEQFRALKRRGAEAAEVLAA